jgi:hypothetical protein
MEKIIFFSHAHRGDICISRPFVNQIIKELNIDFGYAHFWGDYLLRDMNIEYIDIDKVSILSDKRHVSNFVSDGILYINTWIGNYFSFSKPGYGECTLKTTYDVVYVEMFEFIKNIFKVNIELKNIYEYFPTIDYSHFNTHKVDEFVGNNSAKKNVLLCNGPALSGQCEYNGDMEEIIEFLSKKYKDITFITTHKINCNNQNVKYTGDIIQSEGPDLNEISYLSKFCDIIVGRSSGPFIFTNIKDNIFNQNKSFLCFGKKVTDCLPYGMDLECEFIFQYFSNDNTLNELTETISGLIENEKTV